MKPHESASVRIPPVGFLTHLLIAALGWAYSQALLLPTAFGDAKKTGSRHPAQTSAAMDPLQAPITRATARCQQPVQEHDFGPTLGRWRNINCRFWQKIGGSALPLDSAFPAAESTESFGRCGSRMIEVRGEALAIDSLSVEAEQNRACRAWQTSEPTRCALYDRDALDRHLQALRRRAEATHGTATMDFCMDRYEFPNQNGEYPWIAVNWYDSNLICEQQGKRLCTEPEWNFACEGEQTRPYPYEQYEARRGPGNGGCNVGAYPSVEGPSSSVYLSLQASHSASQTPQAGGEAASAHFPPGTTGAASLGVEEAASSAGALGDPVCRDLIRLAQEIRDRQQARENEAARRASRPPRVIPVPPLRTLLGRFAQSDVNYGKVVACLWNARPSGDSPACKSQAGAYDLTGNVDEWVVTRGAAAKIATLRRHWRSGRRGEDPLVPGRAIQGLQSKFPSNQRPYPSPLKGGWWGPVRNRCRPSTTAHGPTFSYYQVGFRCCKDIGDRNPASKK